MDSDNPLAPAETPNPVPHVHHYILKGSGLSCWAECREFVTLEATVPGDFYPTVCGHKLAGDNGPIVGSRAKVERAMAGV